MNILVIGVNGLIGNTVFRVLSEKLNWNVFGSIRDEKLKRFFPQINSERLIAGINAESNDTLVRVLDQVRPNVIINCAGLTKHRQSSCNMVASISINALMPHRLADLCKLIGARLIHVSTDCVFSGDKGKYVESELTDAGDFYGKSKALGEVIDSHNITLRTSTIGHELETKYGLLDWFLSQEGMCRGYRRAVFSGLPTVIFARIIRDIVIPRQELTGLYHIGAQPINKFDLLMLLARVYGKKINIVPDDTLSIDRSLDSTCFHLATGYVASSWPDMIDTMFTYR
jgi:dTDP-4-dehydrorhamnose reductase